jgi:hypothetical protein
MKWERLFDDTSWADLHHIIQIPLDRDDAYFCQIDYRKTPQTLALILRDDTNVRPELSEFSPLVTIGGVGAPIF